MSEIPLDHSSNRSLVEARRDPDPEERFPAYVHYWFNVENLQFFIRTSRGWLRVSAVLVERKDS
jgi:hypothetical protein